MSRVRVALLQMTSCGADVTANQAKGEQYCRRAAALGADIALFPEMWSNGYSLPGSGESAAHATWQAQALDDDHPFLLHFRALACELQMAIAITYLERWPDAPRNTVALIDRHGVIVLRYAKVHTCEFDAECALTPGDDFPVCTLDTASGPVEIGCMICYDREFPESARILMLRGAELILTPNACPLDMHRLMQFRTRALENMVGVAMANYAAPEQNGHSIAVDPVAYPVIDGGPRDTLIVEAGEREGVYLAEFDMDTIRAYRERETWGNAYRRPRLYGALSDLGIAAPFIRADATR